MSMTKIEHIEVGSGGAASIEFTSIPATYTDLYLVVSARSEGVAAGNSVIVIEPNSSSANGSSLWLYGDGSTAASIARTYITGGFISGSGETANTFSSSSIYIPNYAGSANKSFSVDNVYENNSSVAYQSITANLWSDTTAISSLKLTEINAADFEQYSSATLYGITAGSDGTTTVS